MVDENIGRKDNQHSELEKRLKQLKDTKAAILPFKGVYVFASFDLVNSTKIKYRESNWLNLIKELIEQSSGEWFGLKFWKFNGDELLYYAEVTAINQLARILHQIYDKSLKLKDKLFKSMSCDESLGFARDLVGIKTAVWIAYVSDEKDALNAKLDMDYIDFAGINMDEGFRMSKCAIQDKIVVDPKIALLICLVAEELYDEKYSKRDPDIQYDRQEGFLRTIDDVFAKFWIDILKSTNENIVKPANNELFEREKDLFKVVANNFRIVGYEKCKGVWEERPYPIIWYSDNWDKSIESVKYDEIYNDKIVTKELINTYYHDYEQAYLDTLKILKKIYDNVSAFSYVIKKILLECDFKIYSKDVLDKQYYALTYLYYTIVCINKKSGGVLAFLRSPYRGHLPGVWDFEQQKNAYTVDNTFTVTQIEDRFKKNYGIKVKVVCDEHRNTVVPMDIHPIYRRGKIHTGILCFAYVDEAADLTDDEILKIIKSNLSNVRSSYDYPLYTDVRFIHENEIRTIDNSSEMAVEIDGVSVTEMSYVDMLIDSNSWNNHSKRNKESFNQCTRNFIITISDATKHWKENT